MVKKSISSIESALLFRDLYDTEFNTKEYTPEAEIIFGSTLRRESETLSEYNELNNVVDEYVRFEILKSFGLSVKEYMELTMLEKNVITARAKEIIDDLARAMEDTANNVDNELAKLKKGNNIPTEIS